MVFISLKKMMEKMAYQCDRGSKYEFQTLCLLDITYLTDCSKQFCIVTRRKCKFMKRATSNGPTINRIPWCFGFTCINCISVSLKCKVKRLSNCVNSVSLFNRFSFWLWSNRYFLLDLAKTLKIYLFENLVNRRWRIAG